MYEVCDKNSGRVGGKFMERKKHKNPIHSNYYEEKFFMLNYLQFVLSKLFDGVFL